MPPEWPSPFKSSLGLVHVCVDLTYWSSVVALWLSLEMSGTIILTPGQDSGEILKLMICNVLRPELP